MFAVSWMCWTSQAGAAPVACTFAVKLMYAKAANSCAFVNHLESMYTHARKCNYPVRVICNTV